MPTMKRNEKPFAISISTSLERKSVSHTQRFNFLQETATDNDRSFTELANKIALDMLVLGAVVASKTGYRIGRGNGYVDLDFGILSKAGAITDNTIIVATVHDEQVNSFDSMNQIDKPINFLFP